MNTDNALLELESILNKPVWIDSTPHPLPSWTDENSKWEDTTPRPLPGWPGYDY